MPVLLARSSSSVPLALLRPVTGIDQWMLSLLVGVPMVPAPAVPESVKLLAATPVTAPLNVAWKVTLPALVNWPLGEKRLIEFSVVTEFRVSIVSKVIGWRLPKLHWPAKPLSGVGLVRVSRGFVVPVSGT